MYREKLHHLASKAMQTYGTQVCLQSPISHVVRFLSCQQRYLAAVSDESIESYYVAMLEICQIPLKVNYH